MQDTRRLKQAESIKRLKGYNDTEFEKAHHKEE